MNKITVAEFFRFVAGKGEIFQDVGALDSINQSCGYYMIHSIERNSRKLKKYQKYRVFSLEITSCIYSLKKE
jgi:hypothetical protein